MQNTINMLSLAAVQELPRVWGRFDHQRPADGTNQMLMVAGMAALVAVVLLIWLRAARRPPSSFVSNSPARLFGELCRAHGLSHSNRRLLKRVATERGLPSPALVFIEPKHLDIESLPASLLPSASEVEQLRTHLFR
jgi:hypothetical protein